MRRFSDFQRPIGFSFHLKKLWLVGRAWIHPVKLHFSNWYKYTSKHNFYWLLHSRSLLRERQTQGEVVFQRGWLPHLIFGRFKDWYIDQTTTTTTLTNWNTLRDKFIGRLFPRSMIYYAMQQLMSSLKAPVKYCVKHGNETNLCSLSLENSLQQQHKLLLDSTTIIDMLSMIKR